jgi:hypothetical protein
MGIYMCFRPAADGCPHVVNRGPLYRAETFGKLYPMKLRGWLREGTTCWPGSLLGGIQRAQQPLITVLVDP